MKILNKFLFIDEKYIKRDEQIWNAIFCMLNAMQSVLFLFLTTRICGEDAAGVFSIAFSVAYLMIMIGNYGVRNYQATDVRDRFRFQEYGSHRMITCAAMLICSVIYVILKGYSRDKFIVILLFCVLKMLESIEDVFHGAYQQKGRLDIASKIGTIRYGFTIIGFVGTLLITKNLADAAIVSVLLSAAALIVLLWYTFPHIEIQKENIRWGECRRLFLICFPLFISGFFNMYICNASKYAIDKYLNDTIQGYYGMIFMPVFVINLLSSCIYRPHLVQLAECWEEGKKEEIKRFTLKQIGIIIGICAVVVAAGYIAGTWVLSIFYGTNLHPYRMELVILLIGGGMTAVVDFLNNIITVMREQKIMVWIYGFVFILAYLFTGFFVSRWNIMGASLAYFVLLFIQFVIMLCCVMKKLK